jgi:hypothetical protein
MTAQDPTPAGTGEDAAAGIDGPNSGDEVGQVAGERD